MLRAREPSTPRWPNRIAARSERRPDRASARKPHRGEAVANITDPPSRLMPTRRGFVQGYNAQVAVTADQLIVAVQVGQSPNDQAAFVPMMQRRAGRRRAAARAPATPTT